MDLLDDARGRAEELTRPREALHREPEIGLQLPRTQERVPAALDGLPPEISCGTATTSVTAVLRGPAPERAASAAPVLLLRGDMDGLPVQETSGVDYASQVDGAMHACGTTCARRCWSARHACSAPTGTGWPATSCCSRSSVCSVPGGAGDGAGRAQAGRGL